MANRYLMLGTCVEIYLEVSIAATGLFRKVVTAEQRESGGSIQQMSEGVGWARKLNQKDQY